MSSTKSSRCKRCYRIQANIYLSHFAHYPLHFFYPTFLCELYCSRCVIFQKLKFTTTKRSQNFQKDIQQLLLKYRDNIKRATDISNATLGILLDYSKAFDTIDHLTLLEKFHKLNFSAHTLNATGQHFRPCTLQLMHKQFSRECYLRDSLQYTYDSTLYKHSKSKI